jgi:cytochrome b561
MTAEPSGRYSWTAITIHWVNAVLILALFIIGWRMVRMPLSPAKMEAYALHKSIGLLTLGVAALRLLWRGYRTPPRLAIEARWQHFAAHATHALLYVLLFALPLSGWMYNSSVGFPLSFFGLTNVPPLTGADEAAKAVWRAMHWFLGCTLAGLIGMHVAAALYHQFVQCDSVLQRMLPAVGLWKRSRA